MASTLQQPDASAAEALLLLAETDAATPIPPTALYPVLQAPPFVPVPGTFNLRDLGLVPGSRIRPGLLYRSGMLAQLTPAGASVLAADLGVRRVYDLRGDRERAGAPEPEGTLEEAGVVDAASGECGARWCATTKPERGLVLEDFVEGDGARGWATNYMDILRVYRKSWAALCRDLVKTAREDHGGAVLFHCTAGRDRTGVLSGVLHGLAGSPPATLTLDYMLSRVGYEPAREQLVAYAMAGSAAGSLDAPGFANVVALRPASWAAFVAAMQKDYGGWEGYATRSDESEDSGGMGLSLDDVAGLRAVLTGEDL